MTTQQQILDFYAQPSIMTSAGRYVSLFDELPNDVVEIVRIIQGLGIYDLVAADFYGCTIPDQRKSEIHIRHMEQMLDYLLALDDQSVSVARPADKRLVSRCHHFTRVFDAPRSLVFKAWTELEHLVHWLGPQGFTGTIVKMDVRPGGAYRFHMRGPEDTDLWRQGVYREIVEPERLVFTYAWEDAEGKPGHETLVMVTFEEHGGKTKLTLRQAVFESVIKRDEHRGGWTSSLERLVEYLATVSWNQLTTKEG
jgi:uncharacterized protein YndB with AHSA1/START domain